MPKVLPQIARSTRFIDMAAVYAALPQATKDRLAGTQFLHSGRMRFKVRPDCIGLDIFEILSLIDQATPPVTHPGVVEHPYTKEKLIYGNRGFTMGIANRSLDESASLLREIFDFAETDRFVREVQWSMGDIIIWDNRFLSALFGPQPGTRGGDHDVPHHPAGRHAALRQPDADQNRCLRIGLTVHLFPGRQRGEQGRRIVNAR